MVNRDFHVILFFTIAFKEFQLTNEVNGSISSELSKSVGYTYSGVGQGIAYPAPITVHKLLPSYAPS